jgi:hypothetical protein
LTNDDAIIWRVRTEQAELVATPNHPVFVEGRGFVRIDQLSIGDVICSEGPQAPKLSNISAIATADIQTPSANIFADIFTAPNRVADFFIGICGKMLLGQSRPDMTFTTGMRTGTTTQSKTLSVLPSLNIGGVIQSLANNLKNIALTSGLFATKRRRGTVVSKVMTGMWSMAVKAGLADQRSKKSVPRAVAILRQGLSGRCFAPAGANSVITISPAGRARVFNLKTSHHVYFANGLLNHNCDAMGLCGQLLDQMVKGRAGVPAKLTLPDDGYRFRRDRKTVDPMTL